MLFAKTCLHKVPKWVPCKAYIIGNGSAGYSLSAGTAWPARRASRPNMVLFLVWLLTVIETAPYSGSCVYVCVFPPGIKIYSSPTPGQVILGSSVASCARTREVGLIA